jgi:hypothetical protein
LTDGSCVCCGVGPEYTQFVHQEITGMSRVVAEDAGCQVWVWCTSLRCLWLRTVRTAMFSLWQPVTAVMFNGVVDVWHCVRIVDMQSRPQHYLSAAQWPKYVIWHMSVLSVPQYTPRCVIQIIVNLSHFPLTLLAELRTKYCCTQHRTFYRSCQASYISNDLFFSRVWTAYNVSLIYGANLRAVTLICNAWLTRSGFVFIRTEAY